MNINKFEAIGIAASVGCMVLALFLLRVESVSNIFTQAENTDQNAAVVVAGGEQNQQQMAQAVNDATGRDGQVNKLIIDDVVIGDGPEVQKGDTVTVHYVGSLQNGQQFDNSRKRGEPFTFTVGKGKVIPGWEQGMLGMRVGGQRVLVIPPDMAYGSQGYGPIPANATLVFAIELLSIK